VPYAVVDVNDSAALYDYDHYVAGDDDVNVNNTSCQLIKSVYE